MTAATRAGRWKMQASKTGSRNKATNRCTRKMIADSVSMTAAVARHDSDSGRPSPDKVSQEIVEPPYKKWFRRAWS